jgi:hypothetical protein
MWMAQCRAERTRRGPPCLFYNAVVGTRVVIATQPQPIRVSTKHITCLTQRRKGAKDNKKGWDSLYFAGAAAGVSTRVEISVIFAPSGK